MILIAVDGTGPGFDLDAPFMNGSINQTYDQAMKNSFCNQMVRQLGGNAVYYRGPSSVTMLTVLRAWGGTAEVIRRGETKIFLAGYSRGAAAAVETAHYLRDIALDVEAMFLFDPVKREGSLPNAGTVPRNVRNCYIIRRSLEGSKGIIDSLKKWDSEVWDIDPYQRRWMGYTSNNIENKHATRLEETVINGSHGSVGGSPWYEYWPDKAATEAAADWMTGKMKKHGVNVTLKSDWIAQNIVNYAGTLDRTKLPKSPIKVTFVKKS
jgi:pimeloyl-ACP methyl ester carboxylesterase